MDSILGGTSLKASGVDPGELYCCRRVQDTDGTVDESVRKPEVKNSGSNSSRLLSSTSVIRGTTSWSLGLGGCNAVFANLAGLAGPVPGKPVQ